MAEIEFVIEPDGITNDIRWKSVTLVSIHPVIILYRELTCQCLQLLHRAADVSICFANTMLCLHVMTKVG